MTGFNAIYHLARADFLERVRRFSFLVVLGVTVVFGYSLIPSSSARYNGFVMYGSRGIYNSAWIGTIIGLSVASMLSLIGFYLVKDAVSRDYRTRVGQIIAATPLSKIGYMIGKWLSNLTVLAAILAILTIIAVVMQLVRGENSSVNIWRLAAPIWGMSLPVMAWVSALAVLFETVPLLRGTLGYIGYIALWGWTLLSLSLGSMFDSPADTIPYHDFLGVSATIADMSRSMVEQGLDISTGTTDIYQPTGGETVEHFTWSGVGWGFGQMLGRLLWFAGSLAVVLAAAFPFDRFDPARRRLGARVRKKSKKRRKRGGAGGRAKTDAGAGIGAGADASANADAGAGIDSARTGAIAFTQLTPLAGARKRSRLWTLTRIELRMLLAGRAWWWYGGALGLIIASAVVPKEPVRTLLLAIAWAWPTMVWSLMGSRERRFQTESLVFTAARSIRRQLPAAWIAGTIVALVMGFGYGLRLLIAGRTEMFAALIVGAMFVSALALACGVWTGGGRVFQILYPFLCYLGLSGTFRWFDFKGVRAESVAAGMPLFFLLLTATLLVLAVLERRRQIH